MHRSLLPLCTQSSAQPLPSATPEPPSTVAPLATCLRWESLGEASPGRLEQIRRPGEYRRGPRIQQLRAADPAAAQPDARHPGALARLHVPDRVVHEHRPLRRNAGLAERDLHQVGRWLALGFVPGASGLIRECLARPR
jgi:hypothetical protein